MQAEGFTKSHSSVSTSEEQWESCLQPANHIITCVNTSSATAFSVGVACPLHTDLKVGQGNTEEFYRANQCLSQRSRELLHKEVIRRSKSQTTYK